MNMDYKNHMAKIGNLVVTIAIVLIFLHELAPVISEEIHPLSNDYFDLGYDMDDSTIFSGGQRFERFELFRDVEGFRETTTPIPFKYWFAMFSFCMGEHGGTHMDAPYHFNQNGWKLGEIPTNRLMDIPTIVIDVEKDVFALENPQNFKLEVKHILEHERVHGIIPIGRVVLVHFGWGRFWPNKQTYLGIQEDGSLNFPGLSPEAAKWLVEKRKIVGVGVDSNSGDIGSAEGFPVPSPSHMILCGNQVYIIENVANLGNLLKKIRPFQDKVHLNPECDLRIFAMPLKSKGTGGPTRLLAYCKSKF